jgi:hypothetical protein
LGVQWIFELDKKRIQNLGKEKLSRGLNLAQGHRPNGAVARLTLPAIRLSGPGHADQPRPKWPGSSAAGHARHPWSPSGGQACGGAVAQPASVEQGPKRSEVW